MAASSFKRPEMGLTATHRSCIRQRALRVHAAKKTSSPWSAGGPKRGGGKSDGNGGSAGSGSSGVGGKKNGSNGSGSGSGKGSPTTGSGIPLKDKDTPVRQGKPARPTKSAGGGFGAGGANGLGAAAGAGSGRLASRLAAAPPQPPPAETTITDPIMVTLLDELSSTETAAEPRWGTFCSHLGGEWVGQYAAYTPWEGKPEPAWLDERGKYINVVYTRALEQRVKYSVRQGVNGDQEDLGGQAAAAAAAAAKSSPSLEVEDAGASASADLLVRKIGRCTRLAALSDLRLRPPAAASAGSAMDGELSASAIGVVYDDFDEEDDVDVETLSFNSDGVVVFDGGNYSAGPEYIGQQPIKLVSSDTIVGLSECEQTDDDVAAAAAAVAAAARARSGAATSTSAARGGVVKAKAVASEGRGAAATYGTNNSGGDDDNAGNDADMVDGDEDEDSDSTLLPTSTSVFEQCLVDWGSRTRVRVKVTLRIGQLDTGEVDVEVLRILLFTEEWVGSTSSSSSDRLTSSPSEVKVLAKTCTELPRPTPTQLQGSWNVFTMCATGVDEVDPVSGEEQVVWVYSSTEEQQLWDTSAVPPSGDDGGCFWLPGSVVLSLRMVDNYVPADLDLDSESAGSGSLSEHGATGSNGNDNGNGNGLESPRTYPRGLCLGMAWLWREGSVSILEREYDGYGYLREVRLAQGVKGGWSGGRM